MAMGGSQRIGLNAIDDMFFQWDDVISVYEQVMLSCA